MKPVVLEAMTLPIRVASLLADTDTPPPSKSDELALSTLLDKVAVV